MTEQAVPADGVPEFPAEWAEQSPAPPADQTPALPADHAAPGPRTTRTRAILTVLIGLSASGVLVGALWAWIAPSVHAVVAISRKGERVHDYLGSESQNFFVAPFILLGLLGVVAAVGTVLVWQWRDHRGPLMVVGVSGGLIGAALVAATVGALLVRLRYGALDFNTVALSSGEHSLTYVQQAPPVFFGHLLAQVMCTLLAPAGIAGLIYSFLVAGTVRDDLGGYPPIAPRAYPVPQAPQPPQPPQAPVSL